MKIIILFFATLILSSCMSYPHISSLKQTEEPSFFVIEETTFDVVEKGLLGFATVEGLKKGLYESIGSDSEGTYYSGDYCHLYFQRKTEATTLHGGVWMPNKSSQKKPFLFYINPDLSYAVNGLIQKDIAKSEVGNLMPILSPLNEKTVKAINIQKGVAGLEHLRGCPIEVGITDWSLWDNR